jgi:hypothetical protein
LTQYSLFLQAVHSAKRTSRECLIFDDKNFGQDRGSSRVRSLLSISR